MSTNAYKIAVIPGDGIGNEVVPPTCRILEAVARKHDLGFTFDEKDWSCERFHKKGAMMPEEGLADIGGHDSILLGAVGYPGVADHVSLWGLLIPIRREYKQYVSLRPVRLFEGVDCPLVGRKPGDIDMVIVRENNEGEYSEIGGRMYAGTDEEFVSQQSIFTRKGTDRIMRYAFEMAKTRARKSVTSATKSNGIIHSMPYWDERFELISAEYPDIETAKFHIDILAARFVTNPDWFDVVVGSNLFGDILSDLGPGITGTIAIAPSGNINPEREHPSMFEPVHGSAPDIAGQGIANPIGTVWCASMMLDHLGHTEAAADMIRAIENLLKGDGPKTPDMGGNGTTEDMCRAFEEELGN